MGSFCSAPSWQRLLPCRRTPPTRRPVISLRRASSRSGRRFRFTRDASVQHAHRASARPRSVGLRRRLRLGVRRRRLCHDQPPRRHARLRQRHARRRRRHARQARRDARQARRHARLARRLGRQRRRHTSRPRRPRQKARLRRLPRAGLLRRPARRARRPGTGRHPHRRSRRSPVAPAACHSRSSGSSGLRYWRSPVSWRWPGDSSGPTGSPAVSRAESGRSESRSWWRSSSARSSAGSSPRASPSDNAPPPARRSTRYWRSAV